MGDPRKKPFALELTLDPSWTYLVEADAAEHVSLVVVPEARLVLVAVRAGPASFSTVFGCHVAVILPWVTEVLQKCL